MDISLSNISELAQACQESTPIFTIIAFMGGACAGSFSSVCIARLPEYKSIIIPASHCPRCKSKLKLWQNIPIVSWLCLHGRCGHCGERIASKYVVLEVITGILFVLAWQRIIALNMPWTMCVPFFFLCSTMLIVTFVDLQHMIIPLRLTFFGVALALVLAWYWPETHVISDADKSIHQVNLGVYDQPMTVFFVKVAISRYPQFDTALWSPRGFALMDLFLGIIIGGGFLWFIAEFGKLLMGRRRFSTPKPVTLILDNEGYTNHDDEFVGWEDIFMRDNDRLVIQGSIEAVELRAAAPSELRERIAEARDAITAATAKIVVSEEEIVHPALTIPVGELGEVRIKTRKWIEPREVMGLGDAHLLGMIGAFVGPAGAMFVLCLSTMLGAVVGVVMILSRNKQWYSRLAFGPYIAIAAIIFLLNGAEITQVYQKLLMYLAS